MHFMTIAFSSAIYLFIYYSGSFDAPQPEALSHTRQQPPVRLHRSETFLIPALRMLSEKVYTSSTEKRRAAPSLHCFCSDYRWTFLKGSPKFQTGEPTIGLNTLINNLIQHHGDLKL